MTDRQLRERAFYDRFHQGVTPSEVPMDPVSGAERRPWNPAWLAYQVIRDLPRGENPTLLDLGCGAGGATVRFTRIGYRVTGIDVSPTSINLAKETAARNGVADRARFEVGVAEALPFPDNSFDAVVGFDVLHHVDIPRAVAECLRVLRPAGTAVFKEWVRVPVLDALRSAPPARWLWPLGPSIPDEVTEDEAKLTDADLRMIAAACPSMSVMRFRLLARLHRVFRPAEGRPSLLERADAALFRAVPWLRRFGGAAVIVLRKG